MMCNSSGCTLNWDKNSNSTIQCSLGYRRHCGFVNNLICSHNVFAKIVGARANFSPGIGRAE
eukprot:9399108-Lingulodinium_polyedra.AAC.1